RGQVDPLGGRLLTASLPKNRIGYRENAIDASRRGSTSHARLFQIHVRFFPAEDGDDEDDDENRC
ncbi:MAG: hypothetical protein ACK5JM_15420, partial [Rhodoblastus sp.]